MSYCPVERNVETGRKLRLLVFSAFTTGDHGQCCSLTKTIQGDVDYEITITARSQT